MSEYEKTVPLTAEELANDIKPMLEEKPVLFMNDVHKQLKSWHGPYSRLSNPDASQMLKAAFKLIPTFYDPNRETYSGYMTAATIAHAYLPKIYAQVPNASFEYVSWQLSHMSPAYPRMSAKQSVRVIENARQVVRIEEGKDDEEDVTTPEIIPKYYLKIILAENLGAPTGVIHEWLQHFFGSYEELHDQEARVVLQDAMEIVRKKRR